MPMLKEKKEDVPVIPIPISGETLAARSFSIKAILIAAAALTVLFLINLWIFEGVAFFDFQALDWGQFLDAEWRIWTGQKIFVDFWFHIAL